MSTHITYLDTKGRPSVTFEYENLTDKHTGVIYVGQIICVIQGLLMIVSGAGFVQGSVHGASTKTEVSRDRVLGALCFCSCISSR